MAATKKKQPEEHLKENSKPETVAPEEAAPRSVWSKIKRFFNTMAILLLLICLIGGGFFLGIYLKVFDIDAVNKKLGLYEYPIIGQYFVKPAEDEVNKPQDEAPAEPEQTKKEQEPVADSTIPANAKGTPSAQANAQLGNSKPIVLSKEEIDKQVKLQQAEEKKRVTKLARLYEQMKPEEAVSVLSELNNDMIVAIFGRMDEAQVSRILVKFDAGRGAELTRLMYSGKPPVTQVR